jgi:hypothetical protein
MFVRRAWQTYRLGWQPARKTKMVEAGKSEYSELLKTRNSLIFRDGEVWLAPPRSSQTN